MPCRDEGADAILHSELREKHDAFTAMVCGSCKTMEAAGVVLAPELKEWFDEHKRQDAERHKREVEAARNRIATLREYLGNQNNAIEAAEQAFRDLLAKE